MDKKTLILETKEILLLFVLFILLSFLMFSVGLMVGKGLTEAKYEGLLHQLDNAKQTLDAEQSLLSDRDSDGKDSQNAQNKSNPRSIDNEINQSTNAYEKKSAKIIGNNTSNKIQDSSPIDQGHGKEEPFIPIRKVSKKNLLSLKNITGSSKDQVSIDPSLTNLIDESDSPKTKKTHASHLSSSPSVPPSYPTGKFSLQVGSYPDIQIAQKQVFLLHSVGFPYAEVFPSKAHSSGQSSFSTRELAEDSPHTQWYRVGVGFFSTEKEAQKVGKFLVQQKHIKSFLIKKNSK